MAFQKVLFEVMWVFFQYPHALSYIGGFVAEEALLFLTFLGAQFKISLWTMFFSGIAGILTFDSILFFISRIKLVYKIKEKLGFFKSSVFLYAVAKEFSSKYMFATLVFSKLFISMRIPLVISLSHKKISYKKFLAYDSLALCMWGAVMMPLAYLAGKGFSIGLEIAENFIAVVSIGFILLALLYIINRLVIDEIIIRRILKKKVSLEQIQEQRISLNRKLRGSIR
jgi:membrane protein DedA with SNARE-associated domain